SSKGVISGTYSPVMVMMAACPGPYERSSSHFSRFPYSDLMLDVRRLHLLRDLARLGTIAAVAQAHGYTPAAISQQLAALGREAGVARRRRAGWGETRTAAAASLDKHTEHVLAALEAAAAALASVRSGLSGLVRIGAFPTAVPTML